MADSKISELTSATSIGVSDLLYVVQSNTSKKVTAGTLFANAANVVFSGNINLDTTVQLLSSPGAIDIKKQITHLNADATGGLLTIPPGTNSQLKIIVMIANAGGTYYLTSNIANSGNIIFNNVGDTATLLYTDSKWFVTGGTASIT